MSDLGPAKVAEVEAPIAFLDPRHNNKERVFKISVPRIVQNLMGTLGAEKFWQLAVEKKLDVGAGKDDVAEPLDELLAVACQQLKVCAAHLAAEEVAKAAQAQAEIAGR